MSDERCRDIAHVSAVELRTQVPERTVDFFVRLMGMSEVARDHVNYLAADIPAVTQFLAGVLLAARAAGCEDWLREHIAHELAAADAGTLDRMEQGSYQHAPRRAHEMAAASELLTELAVPPRVARASQLWLEELAGQMRLTDGTVRIRDD